MRSKINTQLELFPHEMVTVYTGLLITPQWLLTTEHPVLHSAVFGYYKALMTSATQMFYSPAQGSWLVGPERCFPVWMSSNWIYIKVYQTATDERDFIKSCWSVKCQGILSWIQGSHCRKTSCPPFNSCLLLVYFTFRQEPMTYFSPGF